MYSPYRISAMLTAAVLLAGQSQAVPAPELAPRCSSQGAGNCNVEVIGDFYSNPDNVWWYSIKLYNHNCGVIGGASANSQIVSNYRLSSSLPFDVVLDSIDQYGDFNKIGMSYEGYHFNGYWVCDRYEDGRTKNRCQHAFPCEF